MDKTAEAAEDVASAAFRVPIEGYFYEKETTFSFEK